MSDDESYYSDDGHVPGSVDFYYPDDDYVPWGDGHSIKNILIKMENENRSWTGPGDKLTLETLLNRIEPEILRYDSDLAKFIRSVNCRGYLDYLRNAKAYEFTIKKKHSLCHNEITITHVNTIVPWKFCLSDVVYVTEINERQDINCSEFFVNQYYMIDRSCYKYGVNISYMEHQGHVEYHYFYYKSIESILKDKMWKEFIETYKEEEDEDEIEYNKFRNKIPDYQVEYEKWKESESIYEKEFAFLIKKEEKLLRKMTGKWIDVATRPFHGKLFLLHLRRTIEDGFLYE